MRAQKNRLSGRFLWVSATCGYMREYVSGAGGGNRTRVISLGSWSNTIIRHPLLRGTLYQNRGLR